MHKSLYFTVNRRTYMNFGFCVYPRDGELMREKIKNAELKKKKKKKKKNL